MCVCAICRILEVIFRFYSSFFVAFLMALPLVARPACHINVNTVSIATFALVFPFVLTGSHDLHSAHLRRVFATHFLNYCFTLAFACRISQSTLSLSIDARLLLFSYHAPYSPGFLTGSRSLALALALRLALWLLLWLSLPNIHSCSLSVNNKPFPITFCCLFVFRFVVDCLTINFTRASTYVCMCVHKALSVTLHQLPSPSRRCCCCCERCLCCSFCCCYICLVQAALKL